MPDYCPIHQHFKWCEHNGGVNTKDGWKAPDQRRKGPRDERSAEVPRVHRSSCDDLHPHKTTHEWYWGDGRPCCVNCGTLAYCEDAENMVTRAVAAEAEVERLRTALRRAHDALDIEHGHTAETWDDRETNRR